MHAEKLPIVALPAWSRLNDVKFTDLKVEYLGESKGFGLVTTRSFQSQGTSDMQALLEIPAAIILSSDSLRDQAKVDCHFRQLLEAVGQQKTIAAMPQRNIGVSSPWTQYYKMLPDEVPLPIIWSQLEMTMLVGTSLETAVIAKLQSLLEEFEALYEKTSEIAWCRECWWDNDGISIKEWILLDTLYRSRCLELPNCGEAMVPGIDLANHCAEANAYYEYDSDKGVHLLLRPDIQIDVDSEITINYGDKTTAEMLFNYGFSDRHSTRHGLTLPLEPLPNDPLGKAKMHTFRGPPVCRVFIEGSGICWTCPFLDFICLNEEDGLEFRFSQEMNGTSKSLRVFWQGLDVTDQTSEFEGLIQNHEMKDVFRLRVVTLLQERIRQQLESLYESEEAMKSPAVMMLTNEARRISATQLRQEETSLLEAADAAMETEVSVEKTMSESPLNTALLTSTRKTNCSEVQQ